MENLPLLSFSHAQLESLDVLTEPVWIFDFTAMRFIWGNSAAVDLWDAESRDELLGRNFPDVAESALSRLRDYFVRFRRGETITDTWTFYLPRRGAATLHCTLRGYLLTGCHLGIVGHAHTTTQESVDSDALRFVEALRHTSVLVSLHTTSGELIIQNPQSRDVFGSDRDFISRFADPAEGARVLEAVSKCELFIGEAPMSTSQGLRWHDIKALRTPDPATGQPAILVSASDITERREAEDALAKATEEAEAASRAKSDFLAIMSHEIRTPMNGVMGLAHMLSLTELSDEQRTLCETIYENTQTLIGLVSDVLDFSRLEAGQVGFEEGDVRLDEVVDNVLTLLSNQPSAARIDLFSHMPASLPIFVRGDSSKLRQVLLNLCGNAIKFTERGAVGVCMTVEVQTAGRCVIRFAIKDTGIGIPKEAISRLFRRFEQVDSSIVRRYGGTGLGLAICDKLVALMDGRIGVDSELGVGSTFWFTLPFALTSARTLRDEIFLAGETETAKQLSAPDKGGLRARRQWITDRTIVVAIAHPLTREAVAQQLGELGAEIIPVATGAEAVDVLMGKRRPSLLVTQSQLSDMSAAVLHAQLAKIGQQTPMIVFLKQAERTEMQAWAGLDNLSILVEPITYLRLCTAIRQTHSPLGLDCRERSVGKSGGLPRLDPLPQPLRVLVAEDNPINQRVLQGLLAHMGAQVTVASDGYQAVELAMRNAFDVILMDMQMPNLDGLGATRCIRELPGEISRIPVIALTANASTSAAEACYAAGMQSYLTKPIAADALRDALAAFCPG